MTVIATDGFTMAGDGLRTRGYTVVNTQAKKVHRLKDGTMFGATGNSAHIEAFRRYMVDGGDRPCLSGDFIALVVRPDGVIEMVDENWIFIEVPAPMAIGCGDDLAIGAMDLGHSPKEAVKVAIKRSTHCGGRITEVKR